MLIGCVMRLAWSKQAWSRGLTFFSKKTKTKTKTRLARGLTYCTGFRASDGKLLDLSFLGRILNFDLELHSSRGTTAVSPDRAASERHAAVEPQVSHWPVVEPQASHQVAVEPQAWTITHPSTRILWLADSSTRPWFKLSLNRIWHLKLALRGICSHGIYICHSSNVFSPPLSCLVWFLF
jgi:hypothetical protein